YGPDRELTRSDVRGEAHGVDSDVLTVVDSVRQRAPWHARARAVLVPRSGVRALSGWLSHSKH
ncbi:MAG: hypothetical protein WBG57_13935, partial [Ornithinimicrobium sp.]